MGLQGQGARGNGGYAMAALLVTLAVMAVFLSVAMPAWRHMVQREREEELIFRGEQYARGIGLFQRKYAAAYPPDVDTLVRQKFLRKKYKDPMVPDGEFRVLYQSSLGQPLAPGQQPRQQPGGQRGSTFSGRDPRQVPETDEGQGQRSLAPPFYSPPAGRGGTVGPRGGVIGVVSKSTSASIRLYNGRTHYNEWQFVYTPSMFGPGQARPGMRPGPRPGGPRGNPFQPGGTGVGPGGTGVRPRGGTTGQGSVDPPSFQRPGGEPR